MWKRMARQATRSTERPRTAHMRLRISRGASCVRCSDLWPYLQELVDVIPSHEPNCGITSEKYDPSTQVQIQSKK